MNAVEIGYALAKQVPAMREEVQLYTEHGEMLLQGHEAEQVAKVVERVLYAKLRQLERDARRGRRTRCEEPRECYRTDDLFRVDRRIACGRALDEQGAIASPGIAVTGWVDRVGQRPAAQRAGSGKQGLSDGDGGDSQDSGGRVR